MTKQPEFANTDFKTSSYTANGTDCVEAALQPGGAALRDSKNQGPRLLFGPAGWTAFLLRTKTDHFGREIDFETLKQKKLDALTQRAN